MQAQRPHETEFVRRSISFRPEEFSAIKLYESVNGLGCNSAVITDLLRRAHDAGWLPIELFPATYVCGSLGGAGVSRVVDIPRKALRPPAELHITITGGTATVVVEGRTGEGYPWRVLYTAGTSGVFPVDWAAQMRASVPVSAGATVRVVVRP